jgi:hypothetical protein
MKRPEGAFSTRIKIKLGALSGDFGVGAPSFIFIRVEKTTSVAFAFGERAGSIVKPRDLNIEKARLQ